MIQPFRPARPPRESLAKAEVVLLEPFDYALLDERIVRQVQAAAQCIRHLIKRTLEDLIAIGKELLAVKEALPHGSFVPWLHAEFGWSERTARNFMTVALRFGSKSAIIADLAIDPTAAYLLAAPSVPEEAMKAAVKRAQSGEQITASVAKEILGSFRRKPQRREAAFPLERHELKLREQLLQALESFHQQWNPEQIAALIQQLKDFADALERRGRLADGLSDGYRTGAGQE